MAWFDEEHPAPAGSLRQQSARQHGSGGQHPPAAGQVGGTAAEQQGPAVCEQVAADDPLRARFLTGWAESVG